MSPVRSLRCAIYTSAPSPHSPNSVRLPSANLSMVLFHSVSVTFLRGRIMALPQQPGYVLEAGDQRRRQIDARHRHDGEMGEHRYVGGLRRGGWPAGLAEGNRIEPQEQAAEAHEDSEHQNNYKPRLARESR